jgi:hypothetical protein
MWGFWKDHRRMEGALSPSATRLQGLGAPELLPVTSGPSTSRNCFALTVGEAGGVSSGAFASPASALCASTSSTWASSGGQPILPTPRTPCSRDSEKVHQIQEALGRGRLVRSWMGPGPARLPLLMRPARWPPVWDGHEWQIL